tara:strand:- start:1110 stop:1244 length:135 start_codon:yes stop_codon:yes gene_type:complete
MEAIVFVVAFVFCLYMISDKKTFFYYGPDKEKYEEAFVGFLTRS